MQPQLRVHASLCKEGYKQLEIPIPKCRDKKIETNSLPDTGAKITVVGINLAHSLGIKKSELISLSHGVNPANNTSLKLMACSQHLVELTVKVLRGNLDSFVMLLKE